MFQPGAAQQALFQHFPVVLRKLRPRRNLLGRPRLLRHYLLRWEGPFHGTSEGPAVFVHRPVVVQGRFNADVRVQVMLAHGARTRTVYDCTGPTFGVLLTAAAGHTIRVLVEGMATGVVEVV